MDRIRVVLVDDQVLFVESLQTVLELRSDDIEVVGTAHNGEEGLEVIRAARPDIVLMDVRMPGMDGVEATRRLHQEHPEIKVVMLTTFDDDVYVREAMQYSAVGYILKNIPATNLINSIRAVMDGTIQLSPSVMHKIVSPEIDPEPAVNVGKKSRTELHASDFSRREREVLYFLSRGLDNRTIGEKLFIAEQTVKNQISRIYGKIGSHDRFKAAEIARELDIGRYISRED
ncbi:DNA-binding response regulator [Marispirochaeta aestuarii]|uniref:DNA-binding response regulator n=1 Tax=Marispirochaeta aestuarii TaxID=1963862 RepID=A0A1Y1RUM2_9SPIO|nr:response regulator transcription factor [Marispirochaeta aestuarii]ORC32755.1 DNA-binding response regulator [Marispirochaeta aestuarii]